jgi:cytochrome c peroxidase
MRKLLFLSLNLGLILLNSCSKDEKLYAPIPSPLEIPELFEMNILSPIIPTDNPQTEEGIFLGRKLFFDPILSINNTQSCANCHQTGLSFTDGTRFSLGVNGIETPRNVMPLFNLAWNYDRNFFWDGRSFSLEHQALEPITHPNEMANHWDNILSKLSTDQQYVRLFQEAFGRRSIEKEMITKAIAQFERTLISADSKFDKYLNNEISLSTEELAGLNIFMNEEKGDCFHCHGSPNNPLWTDNQFHNNGLDSSFEDLGLGAFSGDPADNGKFRTPSLRNLIYTAPYMHDGRFETLDDVIDHYSEGLKHSSTIDPLMKKVAQGGVQLTDTEKIQLKAFLLSLSDSNFVSNPNFTNP